MGREKKMWKKKTKYARGQPQFRKNTAARKICSGDCLKSRRCYAHKTNDKAKHLQTHMRRL